jgi:DNA processing protein
MQISKLSLESPRYPSLLLEINNPPKGIYVLGKLPSVPSVAVVGSRRPTEYGRQVTYKLSSELASAGITIVSGLALGIDSIAHQAAIDAGGLTVAVQACGLDRIYPASHRGLAKRILSSGGAIVSEHPEGTPPLKHHFPARNRIISGLSLAVVVTEADASSGSLITANFALEQNRMVMAVPGNITSQRSAGPNNLIKAGAIPITSASDVLAALNIEAAQSKPVKPDSKEEAVVIELISQGITSSEALISSSGLSAAQFANVISLMEITGKVRNLGAGRWALR